MLTTLLSILMAAVGLLHTFVWITGVCRAKQVAGGKAAIQLLWSSLSIDFTCTWIQRQVTQFRQRVWQNGWIDPINVCQISWYTIKGERTRRSDRGWWNRPPKSANRVIQMDGEFVKDDAYCVVEYVVSGSVNLHAECPSWHALYRPNHRQVFPPYPLVDYWRNPKGVIANKSVDYLEWQFDNNSHIRLSEAAKQRFLSCRGPKKTSLATKAHHLANVDSNTVCVPIAASMLLDPHAWTSTDLTLCFHHLFYSTRLDEGLQLNPLSSIVQVLSNSTLPSSPSAACSDGQLWVCHSATCKTVWPNKLCVLKDGKLPKQDANEQKHPDEQCRH